MAAEGAGRQKPGHLVERQVEEVVALPVHELVMTLNAKPAIHKREQPIHGPLEVREHLVERELELHGEHAVGDRVVESRERGDLVVGHDVQAPVPVPGEFAAGQLEEVLG